MIKHVYFWVGAFLALIFGSLVLVGAWSVATEKILNTVSFLLGAMVVLTIVAAFLFLFRDRLIRFLGGRANSGLENLLTLVANAIGAGIRGDADQVAETASELTRASLTWYAWNNLYRWIVATAVSILIAFAGFAGTVLVYQQNEKLEAQNNLINKEAEISRFNLMTKIRELLYQEPIDHVEDAYYDNTVLGSHTLSNDGENCAVYENRSSKLYIKPSESILILITKEAKKEESREEFVNILSAMLQDSNQSVVLGAMTILDALKEFGSDKHASLKNVLIDNLKINGSGSISFQNSKVRNVECDSCRLLFNGSIVDSFSVEQTTLITNSIISIKDKPASVFKYMSSSILATTDYDETLRGQQIDLFLRNTNVTPPISPNFIASNSSLYSASKNRELLVPKCESLKRVCELNSRLKCENVLRN